MGREIRVEVVYATPTAQVLLAVSVVEGATIREVIEASGVLVRFPEIDLEQQKVGVFSQVRVLTDIVQEGDRVEIYRGLTLDPKESRRRRAAVAGQVMKRKGTGKVRKKKA